MKRIFSLVFVLFLFLWRREVYCQLIVGEVDPYILVNNVLVGDGIKTSNIQFTGYKRAAGFFENGKQTVLDMESGIILSSGIAMLAKGPNNVGDKTTSEPGSNAVGSALLELYAKSRTFDAVILQFDFIPQTEEIDFNYIFASEEYIEYVDKGVSDIFGFFISGPDIVGDQNVALVPQTNLPVSIDNVNHKRNTSYFKLNTKGEKTLQADGFTTILKAKLKLIPCQTYTIKLALADVGDDLLDSYVFIESGSFKHKTNIGKDTFVCKDGFDIELDAGNPGRRVLWSTGETTQKIRVTEFGEYWVEVFTDCGSFKDYKKILPGVEDIDLGVDTVYCGHVLNKKLSIPNRKFEEYLWSDGSKSDSLIVDKPGLYWLEVGKDGCKKRDTIIIDTAPIPNVDIGKDTTICGKVDFILSTKYICDEYLWNTGETGIRIQVTSPGKYYITVMENQCYNSDTVMVYNRKNFTVDIGPPIVEICEQDTISFRTGIHDTLNYTFLWSNKSDESAITISKSGSYKVLVRDKYCNYSASDSVLVTGFTGSGKVWVPNAFTPNEDGLNDDFKPDFQIGQFNHYSFKIFDRWGQMIFETNDPEKAWDGYIQGKLAKNDVYAWTLNIKSNCSTENNNFFKGIVHLIH